MPILRNISDSVRWYDRPWAALMFFTRLPLWRLHQPPRSCYESVVEYWPLAGWLTAGVMASVLYLASCVFPYSVAVLMAIAARMLLTGALHEDGLADFFDGFGGGGTDRGRVLSIMKDSHIGTYGVLALVLYVALLFAALVSLAPLHAALTIVAIDPYAKMLASQIVMMMPYARSEQEAKARVVYRKMSPRAGILLALQGLLPVAAYCWYFGGVVDWQMLILFPSLTMYVLYRFVYSRLRGYTGDCCGAFFLLVELAALLTVCASLHSSC